MTTPEFRLDDSLDLVNARVIASHDAYADAKADAARLAEHGISVDQLAIVGRNLKIPDTKPASWGRVFATGALSGVMWGLLLTVVLWVFLPGHPLWLFVLCGVGFGVVYGILAQVVQFGMTQSSQAGSAAGSPKAAVATRFEVMCEAEVAGRARSILDAAARPPIKVDESNPDTEFTRPVVPDRTARPDFVSSEDRLSSSGRIILPSLPGATLQVPAPSRSSFATSTAAPTTPSSGSVTAPAPVNVQPPDAVPIAPSVGSLTAPRPATGQTTGADVPMVRPRRAAAEDQAWLRAGPATPPTEWGLPSANEPTQILPTGAKPATDKPPMARPTFQNTGHVPTVPVAQASRMAASAPESKVDAPAGASK